MNDQLQDAFSTILQQLVKAGPQIKVAGFKAVEFIAHPEPIQNPNEAYEDAKQKALILLDKDHFTDQSPAAGILWTYQNIKRMARWARCSYDKSGALALTREMNDFELLSEPWVSGVIPVK